MPMGYYAVFVRAQVLNQTILQYESLSKIEGLFYHKSQATKYQEQL